MSKITEKAFLNAPPGSSPYSNSHATREAYRIDGAWFISGNHGRTFRVGDQPTLHSTQTGVLHVPNSFVLKYRVRTKLEKLLEGLE